MEWLESEAIATAPLDCNPKLWCRYDVLKINLKKNSTQKLTEHLNTINPTDNIKFTHEEDQGKESFLETLIVRKSNGSLKLLVYRKKTHTDQYLNFQSQHPLHQKLGVIRTLMDRMENVVTEDQDKCDEEIKIREVMEDCDYPKWSIDRVKQQMSDEPSKNTNPKKVKLHQWVWYIEGISEKIQHVF